MNALKKISIFLTAWIVMGFVIAFIPFMFQGFEVPFTKCLQYEGVWTVTVIFGWIPATLIAGKADLSKL